MKNKLLLFLAMILMLVLCTACADNQPKTVRVMVSCSEGVKVTSRNPVDVPVGEDAKFNIEFEENYALDSVSGGELRMNVLTVPGVKRRTTVNLIAVHLGYDTSMQFRFYFEGESSDECSLTNASKIYAGTPVTVSANEKYKAFAGWSVGRATSDKTKMISTDRNYTFRLGPEHANSMGVIKLYANYVESNCLYYNPNGGVINSDTYNTQTNDYYTCEKESGKLKITLTEKYFSRFESASLFFDDATFTKEGFVLAEYNTKPDGSGDSYSLGSKYYADIEAGGDEIYCIWKPVSTGFSVENASMANPAKQASYAPMWKENGVIITGYSGNDTEVVIPEMLGGKYVIGIKEGAFKNKSMETLVLSKYIQKIEDGAFVGCSSLETVYYPDGIYYITDDAFDSATYTNFKNFYVNATLAPRFSDTGEGAFSVKLSRLLASMDRNRIIVIAGSSAYQGFSSEYLEALMSDEYRVINFGTTRTTNGLIYLEAMKGLSHEGDIVLYAPENSTYMMGETELYWKTLRDVESMVNIYRYLDISHYTGVFSAFANFNQEYRYVKAAVRYEMSVDAMIKGTINEYGEYTAKKSDAQYIDAYYVTMNDKYKTKYEGNWNDTANQEANKDYNDPTNNTWASILDDKYRNEINRAIYQARSSGAEVYFAFCPVDADKLVDEAKNKSWLAAYDAMMANPDNFAFNGILGESKDYVYAHQYLYDCAFHLNDTGRTFRTYQTYLDLCELLGISTPKGFTSVGTDFSGCVFEEGNTTGVPKPVDYLK